MWIKFLDLNLIDCIKGIFLTYSSHLLSVLFSQNRSNESLESSAKTSSESILNRGEIGRNVNDVSEGSTTEDYATCTDNSKRTTHQHHMSAGIRKASTSRGNFIPSTPQLSG